MVNLLKPSLEMAMKYFTLPLGRKHLDHILMIMRSLSMNLNLSKLIQKYRRV